MTPVHPTRNVPAHKRARHVTSTAGTVAMAYGHIKDGQTTLVVPSRPLRHRTLSPHVRETVAWWIRHHYRLLRAEGVDRTIARSIARSHAHCAYLAAPEKTR